MSIIAAEAGAQAAEKVGGALYRAATTPLLRRTTVKEVETEDGPKLVTTEAAIPAWVPIAGAILAVLGLQRGIRTGVLEVYDATKTVKTREINPNYQAWLDAPSYREVPFLSGVKRVPIDKGPMPSKYLTETKTVKRVRLRGRDTVADYQPIARL